MTFHVLYEERNGTRYYTDMEAPHEANARARIRAFPNFHRLVSITRVEWVDREEQSIGRAL